MQSEDRDIEYTDAAEANAALAKLTRRSLLVGGLSAAAALAGWRWARTRPPDGGTPWPFRRMLELNEQIVRPAFDRNRLAPTFTGKEGRLPRVNGNLGLKSAISLVDWRLRVANTNRGDEVALTLADIHAMPATEFSTNLYCIEGWSEVGHWKGVRFLDFLRAYPPPTRSGKPADPLRNPADLPRYIALATPDGGYYVGIDMASALHPQTLLCYEMGGRPLTPAHGAPLRLYTPVKYGIKSLKRIGQLTYTDVRPREYWTERGYDWWAGL